MNITLSHHKWLKLIKLFLEIVRLLLEWWKDGTF